MKAVLLAVLTGVLFALSLPPFSQAWLAWFATAPLLIAAQGRRPLERIGLGLIAGVVSGFIHVGLKGDTTARLYGYLPYWYVTGIFCVQAVASSGIRTRWQGLPWVLFVACLGVVLEWLTAFTPLPVTIALSQYQSIGLIQIAAISGMWGISFLLWLANAALADTLLTPAPAGRAWTAASAHSGRRALWPRRAVFLA
jgi:apolipoprotein N-acyltransferase